MSDTEAVQARVPSVDPSSARMVGMYASSKLREATDARLIRAVRARRMLFDHTHPRYMDNSVKTDLWKQIGDELKCNPAACKSRWNNIRDNYRKSLRRKPGKQAKGQKYKYADKMAFMKKLLMAKDRSDRRITVELEDDGDDEDADDNNSERGDDIDDNKLDETDVDVPPKDTSKPIEFSVPIKVDKSDTDQSEPMVEFEYFDKRESVSTSSTFQPFSESMHPVDAFLAGLSPTLKALSPYHLSLAKAEMFATVHKYELKGIMEGGWGPRDSNPLQ